MSHQGFQVDAQDVIARLSQELAQALTRAVAAESAYARLSAQVQAEAGEE